MCSFACVDTVWLSLTGTTWSHPPVLVRSLWTMSSGAVDAFEVPGRMRVARDTVEGSGVCAVLRPGWWRRCNAIAYIGR